MCRFSMFTNLGHCILLLKTCLVTIRVETNISCSYYRENLFSLFAKNIRKVTKIKKVFAKIFGTTFAKTKIEVGHKNSVIHPNSKRQVKFRR
jgi:hypothetical protein